MITAIIQTNNTSMARLAMYITVLCVILVPVTPQQLTTTTAQSTTSNGRTGIEKQVLGPLRVWHIVVIVCTLVLVALVIFCYCYDYRVPRSTTEIEVNHEKRQMNKKYLFMLEKKPEDLLAKPRETFRHQTSDKSSVSKDGASSERVTRHAGNQRSDVISNRSPTVSRKSDAMNKIRNVVKATSYQPDRCNRAKSDPDYFSSAVHPRPKIGMETPLASHPKDLLSLMKKVPRHK